MDRRTFALGLAPLLTLAAHPSRARTSPAEVARSPAAPTVLASTGTQRALRRIEAAAGARLGVALLDTATGQRVGHRADERFPMCSTFKFLAAALVLRRVDQGVESLDRPVAIDAARLVTYSPATGRHAGGHMTMGALCEAAVTLSDNGAANLMLESFGGPAGLTRFARSLGDDVTRLDRFETALNEATPNDPRDTTSPAAMLDLMRQLLLGRALAPASRDRLRGWMLGNTTGATSLKAGLPPDWLIGDKTGAGGHGTRNDIAIVRPRGDGAPVLVAAYLTGATALDDAAQRRVLAEVGALLPDFVATASTSG
ncbi:class A beta-lactamase [Variovorax sp. PvP013]|uniref:class A beta-lactamase n=1 Tax=Variovorax sp. PvP013 TaxID=3156435 RepID=UPI003D23A91A